MNIGKRTKNERKKNAAWHCTTRKEAKKSNCEPNKNPTNGGNKKHANKTQQTENQNNNSWAVVGHIDGWLFLLYKSCTRIEQRTEKHRQQQQQEQHRNYQHAIFISLGRMGFLFHRKLLANASSNVLHLFLYAHSFFLFRLLFPPFSVDSCISACANVCWFDLHLFAKRKNPFRRAEKKSHQQQQQQANANIY